MLAARRKEFPPLCRPLLLDTDPSEGSGGCPRLSATRSFTADQGPGFQSILWVKSKRGTLRPPRKLRR